LYFRLEYLQGKEITEVKGISKMFLGGKRVEKAPMPGTIVDLEFEKETFPATVLAISIHKDFGEAAREEPSV